MFMMEETDPGYILAVEGIANSLLKGSLYV